MAAGARISAAHRASVLVHEAWHHWQFHHGWKTSHPQCFPGQDCDYFYFHTVSAYPFGQLDAIDIESDRLLFHSPYQVQSEFSADLAECGQPWLPVIVTQAVRASGNACLASLFVNNPPWRIGSLRAW